jgi:hypothetical protein
LGILHTDEEKFLNKKKYEQQEVKDSFLCVHPLIF